MFKNKAKDGALNLCGKRVGELRVEEGLSQRALADELQRLGLDVGKNTVQQIEAGARFVTDIELVVLAEHFGVGLEELVRR